MRESITIEARRPDPFAPRAAARWSLADPAAAAPPAMLGRHAVAKRLGIRVARFDVLVARGLFPQPDRSRGLFVGWSYQAVTAWIEREARRRRTGDRAAKGGRP